MLAVDESVRLTLRLSRIVAGLDPASYFELNISVGPGGKIESVCPPFEAVLVGDVISSFGVSPWTDVSRYSHS